MSSGEPAVSVVVATRDREPRLRRLLAALEGQTLEPSRFEVVVVDDGSMDGAAPRLAESASRALAVSCIDRERSEGPAVARNEGWRAARAPLVAFTDDDCEPAADWLERGLAASERWPGKVVQGRTDPIAAEHARRGPFSRTVVVHDAGPFFQTCNIFYPRDLLARLDGFDEGYPNPGGEDTDLALRALEAGVEVRYAEEVLVNHAVEDLGPMGLLRVALRWSEAIQIFRRHPYLREHLEYRVFWKRSHRLLAQAALGLAAARLFWPAALLALPYARHAAARCREARAPLALAPYFALHDAVEMYAAARGGARNRVLVL